VDISNYSDCLYNRLFRVDNKNSQGRLTMFKIILSDGLDIFGWLCLFTGIFYFVIYFCPYVLLTALGGVPI
jgi:hypothetical protein